MLLLPLLRCRMGEHYLLLIRCGDLLVKPMQVNIQSLAPSKT